MEYLNREMVKLLIAMASGNENPYFEGIDKFAKNEKKIYGFVKGDENEITLLIFCAQNKRAVGYANLPKAKFLEDFTKIFEHPKFKAIILQIDQLTDHVPYSRDVKIKLSIMNMHHVFLSTHEYMFSSILIAANVEINVGENIVIVLVDKNDYVVNEYKLLDKGYKEGEHRDCKNIQSLHATTIHQRILGTNNPAKIILHANKPGMKSMKNLREKILNEESDKLVILEECWESRDVQIVEETIKRLFSKTHTKFHILPLSFRTYMIAYEWYGRKYPVITCEKGDILPFKQTVVIQKSPLPHFFAHTGENDVSLVVNGQIELHKDAYGYKITLEIDADNFLHPLVESIFVDHNNFVKDIEKKLPNKKIPIIGIFGELSFIYLFDETKHGYQLLDSWNGKLGRYLFISFAESEPKFFEEAVKKYQSATSNSFVHDIVKTMSTPREKLLSNLTTGYSLINDDKNHVLFEVTNYDGTKKSLTPSLAMAMLIKRHLNEIKKRTGEIPNEIAFNLFDNFGAKSGIKKSCELLQIDCTFL